MSCCSVFKEHRCPATACILYHLLPPLSIPFFKIFSFFSSSRKRRQKRIFSRKPRTLHGGDACLITVLARTLIIYLLLLVAMRLVGKRQIGELQLSELITTLMLSELAVLPISDVGIPISYAILPILTLLSLEVFISFAASRVPALRRIFFGAPSLLICHGQLDRAELARLRIGVGELISELRLKDVEDIGEVRYAILENNGKLSVFKNAVQSPVTPQDVGIDITEKGIALPVIIDGRLMPESMKHAGVSREWIERTLAERGLERRGILLMNVDEQRHFSYIMKDSPGRIVRGDPPPQAKKQSNTE